MRPVIWFAIALGVGTLAGVLCWLRPGQLPDTPTGDPEDGPAWFEDVTAGSGIDFVHDAGSIPVTGPYFVPQIIGSGAALLDFDGDGLLDIYLLTNGGPNSRSVNRLYRNLGRGKFQDVTAGSGLGIPGNNMGVAVGDVNNDGLPDVLITQFGGLKLFLNRGKGQFEDVTHAAGLDSLLWGTSAAFFDFDRDGWLDLVVANYLEYDPTRVCEGAVRGRDYCAPRTFSGQVTKLFRNLGRAGGGGKGAVKFQDVTIASGLGNIPGYGLGVVCADFNGDGWPDIFVANDEHPNHLWINQKDGTFKEEATQRGLAFNGLGQTQANMGIAVADVDGDGLFDLFVTHVGEEYHALWRQEPRGLFQDFTAQARLTVSHWKATGFGTVLADFDHDGAVDLALVNGRVMRTGTDRQIDPAKFWSHYAERGQVFRNDGTGKFRDVSLSNAPLCGKPVVARGLAWGDLDGDGAVDLLVTTVAGPAQLYRNVAPKRGHWLMVRAIDPELGGRDAIGAEITFQGGGRRWVGWINPATSYLCSNDPRAHFGLGVVDRIEAVTVRWPDGSRETFAIPGVDRVVLLRRGEGQS